MKKRILSLALALLLLFLTACGASGGNSSAPALGGSATDMARPEALPAPAPGEKGGVAGQNTAGPPAAKSQDKIIYSADAEIETKAYEESLSGVYQLIEEFDGFLQSSSVGGTGYGSVRARYSEFVIRIPSERFTELTESLSILGNVSNCRTDAQNVTAEYVDIEARLQSYQIQEERLLAMLEKAEKLEDMLTIESHLTNVRYSIEMYTTQLNGLESQVSFSTVTIRIREVVEYSPDKSLTQSFFSRMKTAFAAGISGLVDVLQGIVLLILYAWYLFAAIAVAAVLIIRRIRKKRQGPPSA